MSTELTSYVWNYRQGLDVVPMLVQQLSRLQDIAERMQLINPSLSVSNAAIGFELIHDWLC
jgi:hypothetical protein